MDSAEVVHILTDSKVLVAVSVEYLTKALRFLRLEFVNRRRVRRASLEIEKVLVMTK